KIPPFGNIYFNVFGGKTFGTLPYMLLDVAPGNEIYYYNRYAFNMMNRYEFIHDKYAGFNVEHNFGNGIFRFIPLTRKLKFRQFWTAKGLWGSLNEENEKLNFVNGHPFKALNGKTYIELGTGVDNILKVFRVDFVWRVLPTPRPEKSSERFGVFGSFRLAF
ncbi:MAG TPA: carboxypeptidase-like regulatory domain-containing protein, partial [Chitinophagaceae bacterium]|nr:carboxypeptidase-like regulatory domain-containing protein [Chitinophagaceae bacterium]